MNRFIPTTILGLCLLLLTTVPAFSQTYYWVGGSGNWSDFANHWATSSGGTSFYASAPTADNDVVFDANSFSASDQTVSITADAVCRNMNWTGVSFEPTFQAQGGTKLDIFGNLALSSTMTNNLAYVNLKGTGINQSVSTGAKTLGNFSFLQFDAGAGSYQLQDSVSSYYFVLISGTVNTNNQSIYTRLLFTTVGSAARSIDLTNSKIYCGEFNNGGSNLSFTAGNSSIFTKDFYGKLSSSENFTYSSVNLTSTNPFNNNLFLRNGGYTIQQLHIVDAGAVLHIDGISESIGIDNWTVNSNRYNLLTIQSGVENSPSQITKSSGSINLEYVKIKDISASGGASFNAINSIDNGNNTGWNITAITPLDFYWVGGSGLWSDFVNHWATTTGGNTFHTEYPSQFDHVFFDANSFSASNQEVNLDIVAQCADMTWQNLSTTARLRGLYDFPLNIHGNALFGNMATIEVYNLNFRGNQNHTLTTNGSTFQVLNLSFINSGHYTFLDPATVSNILITNGASLTLGDQDIYVSFGYSIYNSDGGTLNLAQSTINTNQWAFEPMDGFNLNSGTSTLKIRSNFNGGGQSYYNYIQLGAGIVRGNNNFNQFSVMPGITAQLEATSTQTASQFILSGNKNNPLGLRSTEAGNAAFINANGNAVYAYYIELKDIEANIGDGSTYTAIESIDNGNNTNWNFVLDTTPPTFTTETPFIENISDVAAEVKIKSSENGIAYLVVLPSSTDTPSSENIKAGTGASGTTPVFAGQVAINSTELMYTIAITGLSGVTEYSAYVVLEDESISANLSTPANLSFTTLPTARTMYWVGNGGQWSDYQNHWATTSGGNTFHTSAPTQYDHVVFDSNSFTAASQVIIQGNTQACLDFDASEITASVRLLPTTYASDRLNIYGNYSINALFSGELFFINLLADKPVELNGNGGRLGIYLTINNEAGEFNFNSGTANITGIDFQAGKLFLQEDSASIRFFTIGGLGQKVLNYENKIVFADFFRPQGLTNTIIEDQGSSLYVASEFNNGGNHVYDHVIVTAESSYTSEFNFIQNNKINRLQIKPGAIVRIAQNTTLFTEELIVKGGVNSEAISLSSSAAGTTAFINQANGIVNGEYLLLKDITAQGGATFNALNSTNNGNVNGWNFTYENLITFAPIEAKTFGDEAFSLGAFASSGLAISYESSNPEVATINGTELTIIGAGSTTITASQAGDANYPAAEAVQQTLVVEKANQTINFIVIEDQVFDNAPFDLSASASSSLPVTFSVVSGNVSISGNQVSIIGTGEVVLSASQVGNSNYNAAPAVEQSFTIAKANQIITFAAISDKVLSDGSFEISASSDQGMAISFQALTDNISISGSTVTIIAAGNAEIKAMQAGNENYNAAEITRSFNITDDSKQNQGITFAAIGNKVFGDDPFSLSATASSELAVTFSVVSGPISITGNTLTITGAGTAVVRASQAGNANFNAATPVDRSFTINKANQTISFASIENKLNTAAPFTIEASSSAGLGITFDISGPASISGTTITLSGALGTVSITANQVGNDNYLAATAVTQIFEVQDASKTAQTMTFNAIGDKTMGDAPITLSATASSGLSVSFEVLSGPASISGSTLTLTGVGQVSLRAFQAGNDTFLSAEASQTICVNPAKPSITVSNGNLNLCTGESVTLSAPSGFANYLWSTSENTQSITVSTAGNYSVQVSTVDNCTSASSDQLSVTVGSGNTVSASISASAVSICPNQSISFTLNTSITLVNPIIIWKINNTSVQTGGEQFSPITINNGDQVSATVEAEGIACSGVATISTNVITVEVFTVPAADISVSGPNLTATQGTSYRWFYNDEALPLTTRTVNVTKRGLYRVEVTYTSGCVATSADVNVTVIGIEQAIVMNLQVYPNPSQGPLIIQLSEPMLHSAPIQIIDSRGSVIMESTLPGGQIKQELNVESLKSGVYIVLIQGDQLRWKGRIVKE